MGEPSSVNSWPMSMVLLSELRVTVNSSVVHLRPPKRLDVKRTVATSPKQQNISINAKTGCRTC
jgi:hypothetical protein